MADCLGIAAINSMRRAISPIPIVSSVWRIIGTVIGPSTYLKRVFGGAQRTVMYYLKWTGVAPIRKNIFCEQEKREDEKVKFKFHVYRHCEPACGRQGIPL